MVTASSPPTPPVAFLVFNRPACTAQVFARIRAARPARLFIVADGPRPDRPGEREKCEQVRRLIEEGIDWPCEVARDYSEVNLGCGQRVASGLTRVFAQVEEAIILEDDCLPDPTFFRFCAELLEKYRHEPKVGLISGSHHQLNSTDEGESYYFCRYGNIWGWATWRRAWQKFDHGMSEWPQWRDSGGLESFFPAKKVRNFWRRTWNQAARDRRDGWAYAWTFCYLRHGLLGILPRMALVENIGFGSDATHTANAEAAQPRAGAMTFPLRHPVAIEPDFAAEARASERFFSGRSFLDRVQVRLARLGRKFFP